MTDNVVKFPDSKNVQSVSYDSMEKFILYYKFAENAGAEFNKFGFDISFRSMDDFERFCEMLTGFNHDTQV